MQIEFTTTYCGNCRRKTPWGGFGMFMGSKELVTLCWDCHQVKESVPFAEAPLELRWRWMDTHATLDE